MRKSPSAVVIDVGGVGYEVAVPLSTFNGIPEPGADVSLHVHTHVREDSLSLFGFSTELEKELFELLMGVSGIGPKLALTVLSNLSVENIMQSLNTADEAALCRIPGIGKKTAARLCLELKDRIAKLRPALPTSGQYRPAGGEGQLEDAVSALVNLGYKRQQAEDAVRTAMRGRPDVPMGELIRESLNLLLKR
ncbi:MAG: Holliday junction branch migration protein RuvA [Nitrospirota bacterium]|nr:Holliday junction branch migration protein RuvA [Nitrospirota bacterium]